MKKIIFILVTFSLIGCGRSTGVVSMGPDTFMVSTDGWCVTYSTGEVLASAMKEANKYCLSNKKNMMPVSTQTTPCVFGRSYLEAQLQFMCLNDNDYELQRPKMKPRPDVIIEDKR